jgi:uncharacterized protein
MATNDKTKILFTLGEVDRSGQWHDYLQYGFSNDDVSVLLELTADEELNAANAQSKEVWVPLHAWRTLGQIGSTKAVTPLIALFDVLVKDDWALSDLPMVMGMIGELAIDPLVVYLNANHHDEFARVMAADSLAAIATQQPSCRDRVVQCYRDYMLSPDESAGNLNGLVICCLMDFDAKEAIDDIRQLFEKGCVELSCAGDLEEVEIEMGFRSERSTPRPNFLQLHGLDDSSDSQSLDTDNTIDMIDHYLMHYGHDDSVLDVSELDGFFAALACSPNMIKPSQWLPAIWGGEALMPKWESKKELDDFSTAIFAFYNHVMESLNTQKYEALFLEREGDTKNHLIVDEWCNGFLRGLNLWGPMTSTEAVFTEECIQSIRLFATDAGFEKLDTMNGKEIEAQQKKIEPDLNRLFQHFYEQRKQPAQPIVSDLPKVGRNDPCPCGSGKKYKKCCLH